MTEFNVQLWRIHNCKIIKTTFVLFLILSFLVTLRCIGVKRQQLIYCAKISKYMNTASKYKIVEKSTKKNLYFPALETLHGVIKHLKFSWYFTVSDIKLIKFPHIRSVSVLLSRKLKNSRQHLKNHVSEKIKYSLIAAVDQWMRFNFLTYC